MIQYSKIIENKKDYKDINKAKEQLLKYYNLAEMHYQVNQYKQFHIDNYRNMNRNNIDINNETQQDKSHDKKTDKTDDEEFYEQN